MALVAKTSEQKARQLRKADSHPDAPAKKVGQSTSEEMLVKGSQAAGAERAATQKERTNMETEVPVPGSGEEWHSSEEDEVEDQVAIADESKALEGAPSWAMALFNKMSSVEKKVSKAEGAAKAARYEAKQTKLTAERAAETASQAKEATAALKVEVEKLKKAAVPEEIVEKAVEKIMEAKWPSLTQPVGPTGGQRMQTKGWGKGSGKSGADIAEQRGRTITFGQFPAGTTVDTIKSFINSKVAAQQEDIQEVYAYAKKSEKYANRGAARFKTEAGMWKYMQENAGKHKHQHEGQDVYANVFDGSTSKEEKDRETAVRKLTRAIIETVGGDAPTVRADISAKYQRGVVKYKGHEIGEWKEGGMALSEGGQQFAVAFRTLLGK